MGSRRHCADAAHSQFFGIFIIPFRVYFDKNHKIYTRIDILFIKNMYLCTR